MMLKRSNLLLILFTLFIQFALAQEMIVDERGYIVKVGDTLPEIQLKLTNGTILTNKDFKGKVVMLQFTASWCIVCRKEMPFIEKDIQQLYKGRTDFLLVGVDRDEPLEKVNEFAADMSITYPLALDSASLIFQKFAVKQSGVTRNVIINKEGKIVFLTRLYDEAEFEKMKEIIAKELI